MQYAWVDMEMTMNLTKMAMVICWWFDEENAEYGGTTRTNGIGI